MRKGVLLYLLLLAFKGAIVAQTYSYKNYSVKDGLPSSEVYCVFQDSHGYMWFGTDYGVSRFNGYDFKNFSTQHGLSDNTIFGITEDHKGRIWFRSLSGRLSFFLNDSISRLPINDTIPALLKGGLTTSIYVDKQDTLFVGSSRGPGLIKYPLGGIAKKIITRKMDRQNYFFLIDSCASIYGDKVGLLSESQTNYVYFKDKRELALALPFRMEDTKETSSFIFIRSFVRLNENLFAFDYGYTLVLFNRDSLVKTIRFDHPILKVVLGPNNDLWVTFRDGGAKYFKNANFSLAEETFLPNITVSNCFIDNEGGVWLTTLGQGVYYLTSTLFKSFNSSFGLPDNKIQSINIIKNKIWVGLGNSHLVSFEHGVFSKNIMPALKDFKSPITNVILQSDKSIWVCSSGGVFSFNANNPPQNFKRTMLAGYDPILDRDGSVWFHITNLLFKLSSIENDANALRISAPSRITSIVRDKKGLFWIGCMDGIYHYNPVLSAKITPYKNASPLLKSRIISMTTDTFNNIWMASKDAGLLVKTADTLIQITKADGLGSSLLRCIHIDYDGEIWVGTSAGLSRIIVSDLKKKKFIIQNFDEKSGLISNEINTIRVLHDTVWVGTPNGITIFNKQLLARNYTSPPIYITQVKINNELRSPADKFNLTYNENFLVIDFTGLAYKNAGKTMYRYKMVGLDTNWLTTKYRSIQYTSLPPGDYEFKVEAQNNDGVWSSAPATIRFLIAPPFWETWWFRIIVIVALAGFIYWRIYLIKKRERYKTETNRQLTSLELKSIKSQMNPHFLFNSLNALTELTEEKSDEAPKFVTSLSRFYRYSLQNREREFVELSEEVKHIEGYIYMLKVRFGSAFNVSWGIDPAYNEFLIPSHALQLLIENVTKHNVVSSSKPMTIEIFTRNDQTLIIKNNLQRKTGHITSTKVGLSSIGQRYELLTNKKLNIIETIENFSVELPLINPDDYEGTHDRG